MEEKSWEIFMETGEIDAYLSYKTVIPTDNEGENDVQCLTYVQEVL